MRYKRVQISAEKFLAAFAEGPHPPAGYTVISDAVPADAKLINVRHAWPNLVELLLSSDTFPVLQEGEEIPLLTPTLRSEQ